ncbi:hypothetical protein QYM36_009142 [Artemia franciscana]|uniref:Uncharacterized protein n=1 Tax=Artemia franciscana TaxID=6661 RepID=A0AA88L6V0_ARTSF|nr:hypothetical protein QYM36_009142 [Artemia franciscana]
MLRRYEIPGLPLRLRETIENILVKNKPQGRAREQTASSIYSVSTAEPLFTINHAENHFIANADHYFA